MINNIFINLCIMIIFFGASDLLYYFLKVENLILKKLVIRFSLGSCIVGFTLFLAGILIGFNSYYLKVLLLLFFIIGVLFWIKLIFKKTTKKIVNLNLYEFIFFCFIVLFYILNIFQIFAPPTFDDSLAYHFNIPKEYLAKNLFFYTPFLPFNAPHLLELLTVLPMKYGNYISIHLFYYIISLFLALLIYSFTKYYSNRLTALIAVFLVISTPKFSYINSNGTVEIFLALITVSSIWIYIEAINQIKLKKEKNYNLFIIGSILLGTTASIKYYGLFSIIAIGTYILYSLYINKERRWFKIIFLSIIFGLIFSLPFYLKNLYFTGNPVYPAMYNIFGGIDWSLSLSEATNSLFNELKKIDKSIINFILSPIYLFTDFTIISGRSGYGLLILLLLPLVCLKKKLLPNEINFRFLIYYMIVIWIMWFQFAFHRDRHLFIVIILLSIIISYYVSYLLNYKGFKSKLGITKLILFFVLVIGSIPNLASNVMYNFKYVKFTLINDNQKDYLDLYNPFYEDYLWINNNLSKDSTKILNFVGNRQYYLDHEQFYPSALFQGYLDFSTIMSVEEIYDKIKKSNFNYIVSFQKQDDQSLNKSVKIDNKYLLDNYNLLQQQLVTKYGDLVYKSNLKNVVMSRTLQNDSYQMQLYLYNIK